MLKLGQGFVWAPYIPMIVSPSLDFISFSVLFDDEAKMESKKIKKMLDSILELNDCEQ